MYFGQGSNLGTPPPILLFDAYGQYMFNRLPVIVTAFTANMPKDVDYVPIDVSNIAEAAVQRGRPAPGAATATVPYVWLPSVFTISVSMTVQNTPAKLRQFDLDKFRNGSLLSGGGWI
jgi:hypothetical protein